MKIFNYFSYGIPIIGSDLPTIREIVTSEGGIFYKKGEKDKLATAIESLSLENDLYDKKSKYIFKRALELTWEKRGEKIIDFINQVS
jgi:glycosyltransferase involved in cell wall biosynthesis